MHQANRCDSRRGQLKSQSRRKREGLYYAHSFIVRLDKVTSRYNDRPFGHQRALSQVQNALVMVKNTIVLSPQYILIKQAYPVLHMLPGWPSSAPYLVIAGPPALLSD